MDFDGDPFPPSLPPFEEPRIFDPHTTEVMEGDNYQFDPMLFGSPNFFSSPYQSPTKSQGNHTVVNPAHLGLAMPQPPESLADSSSSDSSNNQHDRKHSSDSSRSGVQFLEGGNQSADRSSGPAGILIGSSPQETVSSDEQYPSVEFDSSNRAMECHFDFDSAASSPNAQPEPKQLPNSSLARPRKIPLRPNQKPGAGRRAVPSYGRSQAVLDSTSLPFTSSQPESSPATATERQFQVDSATANVNNDTVGGMSRGLWRQGTVSGESVSSRPDSSNMPYPLAAGMPLPPCTQTSNPIQPPTLHLYPLPRKSRVETQIHVKMTLYPMPPGITKLHMQNYSVAKSKLMAKPKPAKSPHMLELHAMLVCTSAMKDPEKRCRAFARANNPHPLSPTEGIRSSSSDPSCSVDAEKMSTNGGPVNICKGCIERERKRSARKLTKDPEEELSWQKNEIERSICFNTQEVKDWQKPSPPRKEDLAIHPAEIPFPESARQVSFPMRIACYCRHHEEKIGFQIIFTIRDHQDNVVFQKMTDSIMITDDHKANISASASQSEIGSFPEGVVLPSSAVLPQTFPVNHGPAPFRNSYSTTDLQGMQNNITFPQVYPYAMPQNALPNTSATMTPKALSRPASPSTPSGQQHKRRKASISGRIRNDLAMTKLQTSVPESTPNQFPAYASQLTGSGSRDNPGFATPYAPSHGQPMPSMPAPYASNPPTPNTAEDAFLSVAHRSNSMENLQYFRNFYPSPPSLRTSRVPSPTSGSQNNSLPQNQEPVIVNPGYPVPGPIQPQRFPVINKLLPAEGPKAGGIEVTCLGSGFHQGLEVMFGDAQATTTTFWGESALVCLVPPALQAGTVLVTFKNNLIQNNTSQHALAVFRYVDDDEQMLIKHALTLVNRKWNGSATDAGDSARNIIRFLGANAQFSSGSNQAGSQQRYSPGSSSSNAPAIGLETAVLSCLNLVDLDDGPFQANFNAQGNNGQTMLHLSASLGHYRLTAGLLARGAHPDIRDNNGLSPMHLASLRGHAQIIRKLRSAGADPTLRSLNGFTPADMASSQNVLDASSAFGRHTRSRSAEATPVSQLSRASSAVSLESLFASRVKLSSNVLDPKYDDETLGDGVFDNGFRSHPATPAQLYSRSRCNSMVMDQQHLAEDPQDGLTPNSPLFAANPALSAWRDHFSAQIQQLQQSMHRTLPALQIPTLPPMPNLPDYQAYPVVRRISSLVPQRSPRPQTAVDGSKSTKEADYHWWELLTGAASSPPAYEDIYPDNKQKDISGNKMSLSQVAPGHSGDADLDHQAGSSSIIETVDLGSSSLTKQQRERLRTAHAMKVKKLRNDRKLIFIWIPLLFLVLSMMLKDRVPKALEMGIQAYQYASGLAQGRVVEVG